LSYQDANGHLARMAMATAGAGILALCLWNASAGAAGAATEPEKVLGPDSCGECHQHEVESWKASQHATGADELHRLPVARDIAQRLDIRRLKTEERCIRCHYTVGIERERERAIAGVSCESCHGAARDWVKLHDDYGGAERESESDAHREERIARSSAAGMIWPRETAELARNCYECHVIDDPELIEKGGHPTGHEFELVAWTQGEVRHNGKENRVAPMGRQRRMYVLGQMLELEHSLRALGKATGSGLYLEHLGERVARARAALGTLSESVPELAAALEASAPFEKGEWNAEVPAKAAAAAEVVAAAIPQVAENHGGRTLQAVDPQLPDASSYRGTPHQAGN
jgi:hypothetical protein